MGLVELYNEAGADTYVGRVREQQSSDAGAGRGVNFFDGSGRDAWSPGGTPAPDEFQDEFKRNDAGDFRYAGGSKNPGSGDGGDYVLSRWLAKSLKIAFGGEGPRTLTDGYWNNNRFTTVNDTRNSGTELHRFAPVAGRTFEEYTLPGEDNPGVIKNRTKGAPSGPVPGGLGG
jgi:hypothetical protein